MQDFNFISPTKIYFGKGKEKTIGEICVSYGFKDAYIIIGQHSAEKSGLLKLVTDSLDGSGVKYRIYKGIRPNPRIEDCRNILKEIKASKPDLILAIGGGSVIDTAKNVACGFYYDGDSLDFHKNIATPTKSLPLGVILTISAAGSELSDSCVIQDDEHHSKQGFNSDICRPLFAIENPELTYSCPKDQTAYGIVDIMMHSMERYFQKSSDIEPADRIAESIIKSTIEAGRIAYQNPNDYESRAVLMLMSSLSHNGLTHMGKKFAMPVHQLEKVIPANYNNIAHGAGLALLFPKWAKLYIPNETKKFAAFARNVFDVVEEDDLKCAYKGLDELEKFYEFLGMPKNFRDLGIYNPDAHKLAIMCTRNGTTQIYHHSHPLSTNEVEELYKECI